MIDMDTVIDGEITQIDYDDQNRINKLHVLNPYTQARSEIRIRYPAEPMPDLAPGQRQYAVLRTERRPEVSVVRLG